MELIHIGGLISFVVRFLAIFKKHPNILLDRTPTKRYSDDGENDRDIKISSLSNPYEQMYWPSVDFSKLCTAARKTRAKKIGIELIYLKIRVCSIFFLFNDSFIKIGFTEMWIPLEWIWTYLLFSSNLQPRMKLSSCHIWRCRPWNRYECNRM